MYEYNVLSLHRNIVKLWLYISIKQTKLGFLKVSYATKAQISNFKHHNEFEKLKIFSVEFPNTFRQVISLLTFVTNFVST